MDQNRDSSIKRKNSRHKKTFKSYQNLLSCVIMAKNTLKKFQNAQKDKSRSAFQDKILPFCTEDTFYAYLGHQFFKDSVTLDAIKQFLRRSKSTF